jgi:uncharacterized Zn finger protein
MRTRFHMTERERIEGRLAAAKAHGGARAAIPRDSREAHPVYTVTGSRGDRYRVDVVTLDYIRCTCDAAVKGRGAPCWHAAAAFLRAIADSAVQA